MAGLKLSHMSFEYVGVGIGVVLLALVPASSQHYRNRWEVLRLHQKTLANRWLSLNPTAYRNDINQR